MPLLVGTRCGWILSIVSTASACWGLGLEGHGKPTTRLFTCAGAQSVLARSPSCSGGGGGPGFVSRPSQTALAAKMAGPCPWAPSDCILHTSAGQPATRVGEHKEFRIESEGDLMTFYYGGRGDQTPAANSGMLWKECSGSCPGLWRYCAPLSVFCCPSSSRPRPFEKSRVWLNWPAATVLPRESTRRH